MNSKSRKRVRAALFKRQGGLCCYCGEAMWLNDCAAFAGAHGLTLRQAQQRQCTTEHLTARCDGGADTRMNVAAACRVCNQTRHRRKVPPLPALWRSIRRRWASAPDASSGTRFVEFEAETNAPETGMKS